ncbi:TetR/AcrR family transcriptional regulator [Arthrobacter sp. LS16]|uniref:TetR/AcrR family transcriptional regulator n=1 Tax=Arthrobacter sp. 'calajunan' TaxID=1690248 RepID=UPI003C726055
MARTLAFDRAEAVRRARSVFWSRGYESASVPELEAATGLSRSSIYNSFGSKRGLFDAAVDSYLEEVVRPRLEPFTREEIAADSLQNYLTSLASKLENTNSERLAIGCMLVNSANSTIANDKAVAGKVSSYRQELHDAFGRGLRAARPDLNFERHSLLTDTITGLVIGAFSLVRVSPVEASRLVKCAVELSLA